MNIGIVGLGYVGLPLQVAFARAGADVVGLDLNESMLAALREGKSHIEDVADSELAEVAEKTSFTSDVADLAACDAILICVPTPLTENREPDLRALESAGRAIGTIIRPGQLVVLESTTYPGTTRERLVPLLEASGLKAGSDFAVAFSPERVDPGRTDFTLRTTPKVVGGLTEACADRAIEVYGAVCDHIVKVSSPEAAEMTKLLENIFRSVNIALMNELAMLADRMGIDIWEVVDAAATKPYGFMRFEPGPGMGGHCLPVDPFYLSWRARQFDLSTEFIELAGKVNQQMPYYCVDRIASSLNDGAIALRGAKVLLVGVSYKAGVGDIREAPSLKIAEQLLEAGADLSYHDPHVAELKDLQLTSVPLEEALESCDIAVIVTVHPSVDHQLVMSRAPRTLDLRGISRGSTDGAVIRL
ncbi:MAG: nucleotide sugar dehydrogenase [Solirubrobacterales bacterium]|nr:nucleotide sugar dehydrogenase [Solirubrobacterales bacterium]